MEIREALLKEISIVCIHKKESAVIGERERLRIMVNLKEKGFAAEEVKNAYRDLVDEKILSTVILKSSDCAQPGDYRITNLGMSALREAEDTF